MSATRRAAFPHLRCRTWLCACKGAGAQQVLAMLLVCFLAPWAGAQTIFQDDLEAGPSNWAVYAYPGAPACTPLTYASTGTVPNVNHTAGGAFGFEMLHASDREVHDLDPATYGAEGLHLSLWYYDAMRMTYGDFEAFDLRNNNNSQILGFATRDYTDRPNLYWVRVLGVTGYDPTGGTGYYPTSIQRTAGWHHLEIYQYRDPADLNTAEFYVDSVLALRETDVVDTTLSRVVLGLGWSGNPSQTGYVDDISVQAIPEPGVAALTLVGAAAVAVRFRRVGSPSSSARYTAMAPRRRPAGWVSPTPGAWGMLSAPSLMRSGGSSTTSWATGPK